MIERQAEDMLWQMAPSTDYTAQALRATNPPINKSQHVTRFDKYNDIGNNAQQAQI